MGNKTSEVQTFFDKETARYLDERYSADTCESYAYNSRKAIVLNMLEGSHGSIIDVGCGPGIFTRELLERGFSVTAADISPEMLKKAQELTGEYAHMVTWANCDIDHISFPDNSFDNVIAIGVIAYAEHTVTSLSELHRILKIGGTLILQCTNSICPTKKIYNLKDSFLYFLGLRQRYVPFRLTSHRYGRLKGLLEQCGFTVVKKQCYDFRIPFLEAVAPEGAVTIMKCFHRWFSSSTLFGWLGEGYILKAVKRDGCC